MSERFSDRVLICINFSMIFALFAVAMTGCQQFNQQTVTPILKTLAQVGNTAVADATQAKAVALAATPPDTDGANCWSGVIAAIGEINQVNAAATGGPAGAAGVFTGAEMASLFQPGSAQYNQVTNLIATSCVAKANDVLGAANVLAAGGVVAVLPKILPLAAAS
jgi:hypothetical protein